MKYLPYIAACLLWSYWPSVTAQTCNTNLPNEVPDSRYLLKSNGTVVDTKTGLTWMRCALGQTWTAGTGTTGSCTGNYQMLIWQSALQNADSKVFAGYSDWRLPNYKELLSLMDYHCISPAINLHAFPNTPGVLFWTSTSSAYNDPYTARSLNFDNGDDDKNIDIRSNAVRLVRGGF
jgi:hypothetical protein